MSDKATKHAIFIIAFTMCTAFFWGVDWNTGSTIYMEPTLPTSIKSGIIIELISENYADNWWNSLVVFTMSANDLYKIPDIIEQQIVMDIVDEKYVTDNVNEIAIIVYNDYLE